MHRTVTKLFVRDIYLCKFLDFKSIHEHEQIYRHMPVFTKGPSININVHRNPNNVRKGGGG